MLGHITAQNDNGNINSHEFDSLLCHIQAIESEQHGNKVWIVQ